MTFTNTTRRFGIALSIALACGAAVPAVFAGDNPLDLSDVTTPTLPKSTPTLDRYVRAANGGDVHAMMEAGAALYNGDGVAQDYDAAVRWFRKAAAAGNAWAMQNLGIAAEDGHGLPQDDAVALGWFRKASDLGLGRSDRKVAYYTQKGQGGLTADVAAAVPLYQKAVDDGYNDACNDLGFCYYNGVGVTQDSGTAVKWFRQGAEGGDRHAMKNLAVCLRDGTGCTADPAEARKWEAKAKAVENGTAAPAANTSDTAFAGTQADLVGTWAVSGPAIHNKPTVEFVAGGSITIKDDGGSESQMGGHIWAYANSAITFNGGGSINDLDVSGSWKVQWVTATEFKTTDANGNALTLTKR